MTPSPVVQGGRPTWLPVVVLLFSASLWGLSWWPLKQFGALGLSGPVLALLSYALAGVVGLPWLWRERPAWWPQARLLLLLGIVGGWANAAFVSALVQGDVVRVMLLFYLSPVWSVLGGRLLLGETVSRRRALAVLLALSGAFLVVGGLQALDAPLATADLLALSAGIAFAGNNLVSRAAQGIPLLSKTVAVFVGCGVAALLMLRFGSGPANVWPVPTLGLGAALLAYSLVWMVLATATWQYGVTHMEAGRSGVILIAELLVALVSAALLGGGQLLPRDWLAAALIAAGALLEATDTPAVATDPDPHTTEETA
jgi:drug/metabolite transporter (DMT)-like permease